MKFALYTVILSIFILLQSQSFAQWEPSPNWLVNSKKTFSTPTGEIIFTEWLRCPLDKVGDRCPYYGITFPDKQTPFYLTENNSIGRLGKFIDLTFIGNRIFLLGTQAVFEYEKGNGLFELEIPENSNSDSLQALVHTTTTGAQLFLFTNHAMLELDSEGSFEEKPYLPIFSQERSLVFRPCTQKNRGLILVEQKNSNDIEFEGIIQVTKDKTWRFDPYPPGEEKIQILACKPMEDGTFLLELKNGEWLRPKSSNENIFERQ